MPSADARSEGVYRYLGAAIGLFAGMMVLFAIGRRLGRGQPPAPGLGTIDAALLGLLSLVLAFTFSGAANRFDSRRRLTVDETNAISTAWLRVDLMRPEVQPKIREDFRKYVAARLDALSLLPDYRAAVSELDRARTLLRGLWTDEIDALRGEPPGSATILNVQAMNAMIDLEEQQATAVRLHPPLIVYALLVILALVCALELGEVTGSIPWRWWFRIAGATAALVATTFFVILELEHPRAGLIGISDFDRELVLLQRAMEASQ
jgi:hypothetical protein